MSINAVSSLVSSSVAVAARPVVLQEVTTTSSVTSQPVTSMKSNSAEDIANSADGKQDNTTANNANTTKQPSENELAKVTDEINNFMESMNTDIQFVLHTKTNELMVQVQEGKNRKVLKEFPAHELLDAVARMREYVGLLLDKKV